MGVLQLLLVINIVCSHLTISYALNSTYEKNLQSIFPNRYQWVTNDGYCGEVSLIVAGLAYGQYLSQYDARISACGTKLSQAHCEMLIGVNDETAAAKMHLVHEEYNTRKERSTQDFLVWIKQSLLKENLVIIGVFMNEYIFYGDTDASAGDSEYDHIVPVVGIQSTHPLSVNDSTYYGDDIITFSDNGLFGDSRESSQYIFSYKFDDFQKTRIKANARTGDVYSLSNANANYGISISGLADPKAELFPVRVETSVNYEEPAIKEGSNTRPTSTKITLTITVSGLSAGVKYNLYRYNSLDSVPASDFNAHAATASEVLQVTVQNKGENFVLQKFIQSDEAAIFRCVKA